MAGFPLQAIFVVQLVTAVQVIARIVLKKTTKHLILFALETLYLSWQGLESLYFNNVSLAYINSATLSKKIFLIAKKSTYETFLTTSYISIKIFSVQIFSTGYTYMTRTQRCIRSQVSC